MPNSFPLVSILIICYKQERFIKDAIEGALNQDYPNIEILFSDNCSTDNSWDIALKYNAKHPDLFFLARNRKNFGAAANQLNCLVNVRGDYLLFLASDDYIKPNYISKCVNLLETHLDTAFVMVHRSIIDNDGAETQEAPFYDSNYKLYPPSQIGVYFMSPVNPCISQVFYRSTSVLNQQKLQTLNDTYYGHRFVDFQLCLQEPIIYLAEVLTAHRVHNESDSEKITENLIQIVGQYVLNHQFEEMARPHEFSLVDKKFEKSLHRIAEVSLKYSVNSLIKGKKSLAKKYWHLSIAIDLNIGESDLARQLQEAFYGDDKQIIETLKNSDQANVRTVSYKPDPPFEHI